VIRLHKKPDGWSVVLSPEMSIDGFTSERAAGRFLADWLSAMSNATRDMKRPAPDPRAVDDAVQTLLKKDKKGK